MRAVRLWPLIVAATALAIALSSAIAPLPRRRRPPVPPGEGPAGGRLPGELSIAYPDRSPSSRTDGGRRGRDAPGGEDLPAATGPSAAHATAGEGEEEDEEDEEAATDAIVIDGYRVRADGTREFVGPGRTNGRPPYDPGFRAPGSLTAALDWLEAAQREDGSFEGGPGVTALALIAHLWSGHNHRRGPRKATVRKALKHLKKIQKPDGRFEPEDGIVSGAEHTAASFAMAEAWRITLSPLFKQSASTGITHGVERPERELANALWSSLLLRSRERSRITGSRRPTLPAPGEARDLTCGWEFPPADGTVRWAAFVMLAAGEKADPPETGVDDLDGAIVASLDGASPVQALFLVLALEWDGTVPDGAWRAGLAHRLAARQVRLGDEAGSFVPEGPLGTVIGRAGTTAAAACVLALCCTDNPHPITR